MAKLEFSLNTRLAVGKIFFGGVALTPPESYVLKAYSNEISATGTGGTELAVDGYSPIEFDNDTTTFPDVSVFPIESDIELSKDFEEDATIVSLGLFDQDDNFIGRKVYDSPLEISAGQKWRFTPSSINLTVSNPS